MAFTKLLLLLVCIAGVDNKAFDPCANIAKGQPCDQSCCHNTLKCNDEDGRAVYLGADSVVRVNNNDGTYSVNVAYRYYNTMFQYVSRNLKPTAYNFSKWHPSTDYTAISPQEREGTECFLNNVSYSNLVATLYFEQTYLVVCGNTINLFKKYDKIRAQFQEKSETKYKRDDPSSCPEKYKPLCTTNDFGTLIDAFTLPDGSGKELMVAYYGEAQIADPTSYITEYTIYSFDGQTMKRHDKSSGQLSAIDIFEIEKDDNGKDQTAYGLYFTNSGKVCPFKHEIGSESNFNFENSGSDKSSCRSLQTFLACPQAWCVDAFVDASFTVQDENNKELVYFLLYRDIWVIEVTPLPVDVPLVSKRFTMWTTTQKCSTIAKSKSSIKVVDCLRRDSSAAFAYLKEGKYYVFTSMSTGDPKWQVAYDGTRKDLNGPIGTFKVPDAAWFDQVEQVLYLFSQSSYIAFKFEGEDIFDGKSWKETGKGSTADLGLVNDGEPEGLLEAVVSMNGSNYFFNQKFHFKEIRDGEKMTSGESRLIQKDFFRLKSQCYYNDLDGYIELMEANHIKVDKEHVYSKESKAYIDMKREEGEKSSVATFVLLIVITGFIVCVVGLLILYLIGSNQPDVYKTRVVRKYESEEPKGRSSTKFRGFKSKAKSKSRSNK